MFIENRDNTLNNLILTENVGRNGYKILSNIIKKQIFKNTPERNEKIQLERYFKNMTPDGVVKVKYTRKHPFGRCNAEYALGLHMMRRAVRHTLCSDLYEDIDMVCCHQTILLNICNNLNLKCPILEKYVNDRDSILKQVMDFYKVNKSSAKTLFISMTNGGTLKKWFDDNSVASDLQSYLQIVKSYKTEMNRLAKILIDKSPEIYDFVKTIKEKNINGSFMSYYLQEIECRILEQVYLYCVEKNYIVNNNVILTSDGIMLQKQYYNDNILKEFTNLIINKFNFKIEFINKPMNEILEIEITPEPEKTELPLYEHDFSTGLLADYFREKYDNWVFSNNQLYYFEKIRWIEDNIIYTNMHNFIDSAFYKHLEEYATNQRLEIIKNMDKSKIDLVDMFIKNIKQLRKINFRKSLISDIINKICDDSIKFDTHPLLFVFDNVIYDLGNKKFLYSASPKLFLKTSCGYDYDFNYDTKNDEILRNLLDTIFKNPDVKNYYLSSLSTGLWAQLVENLFICTGSGGNGKSLINSLMLKTVGDYGYILPTEVLLNNISTGANPQVANLNCKRFVLASEPDSNQKINAGTLKEITGNTELNARMLHSNNCKVKIHSTLFLECNDVPAISEVNDAINRRIRTIPFNNSFVSKEMYEKIDDETKASGVYVGNPYYKSVEFQEEYKQALFNILIEYFEEFKNRGYEIIDQPDECKKLSSNYLQNSDEIYEFIKDNFRVNNEEDNGDFVYLSDIYDVFSNSKFYINLNKQERRRFNKKYLYNKIENNLFLRKYYKDRDTRFNGSQLKKPALIKWTRK